MAARKELESSRNGGLSDFFWNLVGGAMVASMLSGVIYVLVGSVGQFLKHTDRFWELTFLKWYFIAVFAAYLLMPVLLANIISFIFGSKSKASGTRPR